MHACKFFPPRSRRLIWPMSAEPRHDSTTRNKDAIRTLDHHDQLGQPTVDRSTLLCRIVVDAAGSEKTLLVVHSQPSQLHLIVNERLQRIWDFDDDIITICWNDTGTLGKDLRESTELLVGTLDGRVWNVALMNPTKAPPSPKKNLDRELRSIIKIEDDDEKDIEEIELWNDEDGLLDGFDQLQNVAEPPSKRQRIGLSSSQKSRALAQQQESGVETIRISEYNNLVGAEPGLERIAKTWDRLMVFRHGQDPIVWSSSNQFQSRHSVSKTLVALDRPLGVVTSACLEPTGGLCIGTRAGLLWRFTAPSHAENSFKAAATCCKLIDEPILVLQPLYYANDSGGVSKSVLAAGASGYLASLEIPESQSDPFVTHGIKRRNVVIPVHSVVMAEKYLYIVTTHGEVHRISTRLFNSSDVDTELVTPPHLRALTPILRRHTLEGFYGLQQSGALVHMTVDLKTIKRDRAVMDVRENIDDLLQDLERLNEQAKGLELECQEQNARIANYNQMTHALQMAVLASNSHLSDPLVDLSITAVVRDITKGFTGQRRHVVKIKISSTLKLDWSRGWTVVFRTVESRDTCHHCTVVGSPLQHEIFAEISNLSPHSPWMQELELDTSKTRLPLVFHVSLQYNETSNFGGILYTSNFFIESFDLDALHFADPCRDLVNGHPGYTGLAGRDMLLANQQTRHQGDQGEMAKGGGSYCPICKEDIISGSQEPLVFSVDTADIQLEQCLSAILADCLPDDKVRAMLQATTRAVVAVPDICLPNISIAAVNVKSTDTRKVWINLEEQHRHGTVVKASLHVNGADPWRVALIYQGLKKRIAALFD